MMYLSQPRDAQAKAVVIFIPHAGGHGESYLPWFKYFSHNVDCRYLQLPARGKRMNETMPDTIDDLTDSILSELALLFNKPIAFFGHSMGGIITFELARKMEKNWNKTATALFISGCRAPSEPLKNRFSDLNDNEFIRQLAGLGGIESTMLERPELYQLFLPTLRQDIALCENHACRPPEPLHSPLHIMWGTEDHLLTDEMIAAWSKYTFRDAVRYYPHRGDHFYHRPQSGSVISIINNTMKLFMESCGQ